MHFPLLLKNKTFSMMSLYAGVPSWWKRSAHLPQDWPGGGALWISVHAHAPWWTASRHQISPWQSHWARWAQVFLGGGQCFVLVFIEYFLGIVLVSFVRFYKGRPGGRNASVQKPFWERRSVHQVWRAVSWERLDQHRETNGEFPAVLMLLTKTFFFLNHLLK